MSSNSSDMVYCVAAFSNLSLWILVPVFVVVFAIVWYFVSRTWVNLI